MWPACWLAGADGVQATAEVAWGDDWIIERNSCLGLCDRAPAEWLAEPPIYSEARPGEVRVTSRRGYQKDPAVGWIFLVPSDLNECGEFGSA